MGTDRLAVLMLPIMAALLSGLELTTGFHVAYKANERGAGIVTLAAWRQRVSAAIGNVTTAWRAWFTAFWTSRHLTTGAATIAIILSLAYPSAGDALQGVAFVAVAGQMNIAQLERDLTAKKEAAASLFEKHTKAAQAHTETDKDGKVVATGRLLTDDEKKEIQALIDDATKIKAQIDRAKGDESMAAEIERLTAGMAQRSQSNVDSGTKRQSLKSLGQQWTESAAGKFFFDKHHQGHRNWSSPTVELMDLGMHATTLTTVDTSGGDLILPDYRPGILPLLFKRLTVSDLIASGTTDSNMIKYMKETTFTNAAATVAEAASKPESTLIFDLVTDLVQKIAHWLPVTEEMLEDASQIRSYIDARLRLGVELVEEDQLLNGDGTPPNISGILDRAGLTAAQARGADTNADAIFKEMMKIFNASFLMPDGHVVNPANWQTIQLAKDTNGQYYGSGPFAGPQAPTLWGLPVAVTPSIVANTALTGAFKQASQVFRKGGIRVEASNSHSDYFIKNLVAIRAEERLALAVYREAAFGTSTGLN